jgi:hypothetical protein
VVRIDVDAGRLDVEIDGDDLTRGQAKRSAPPPRYSGGVFARYGVAGEPHPPG